MSYDDMISFLHSLKKGDVVRVTSKSGKPRKVKVTITASEYKKAGMKMNPVVGITTGRKPHPNNRLPFAKPDAQGSGMIQNYRNMIAWQPTSMTQVVKVLKLEKG